MLKAGVKYFDENGGNYNNFCTSSVVNNIVADIDSILPRATSEYTCNCGPNMTCSTATSWCAEYYDKEVSSYYCVDSTGNKMHSLISGSGNYICNPTQGVCTATPP